VDGALRRWTFSKDGPSHHDAQCNPVVVVTFQPSSGS
jgi:hypothetical protein